MFGGFSVLAFLFENPTFGLFGPTHLSVDLVRKGPPIHVVSIDHQDGRELKREAAGSGTIITPEGHVVTNHHVAGKTKAIVCTLASREEIPAELVGTDPLSDIAVIKLKPRSRGSFRWPASARPRRLKVGDRVLALGSPLALSQSVTMGIVSNTEMIMPQLFWPFNRMTLEGEDVGSLVRWIGHDAPIFGGNSGGPLINLKGGDRRRQRDQHGSGRRDSRRPREGSRVRDHQDGPREARLDRARRAAVAQVVDIERGALVGGTIEGSPAAKAGFQPGDIVLSVGGQDVNVRFAEEIPLFNQMVMRLAARQAGRRRHPARRASEDAAGHAAGARERRGAGRGAAARRDHGVQPDGLVGQGAEARQPRRRARPRRAARRSR